MKEPKRYVAMRRMTIAGKIYKPGDESDLDGVGLPYIAHLLGREFFLATGGLDSLDDELFLMTMEERD